MRDFFGDGSLYIVDAPGHMEGHVNLLARTSADGAWIYLTGDSCHHCRLLSGESEIATYTTPEGKVVAHAHVDKDAAEATIEKIRAVKQLPRVRVLMAHDIEWYEENKDKGQWPAVIPSL